MQHDRLVFIASSRWNIQRYIYSECRNEIAKEARDKNKAYEIMFIVYRTILNSIFVSICIIQYTICISFFIWYLNGGGGDWW